MEDIKKNFSFSVKHQNKNYRVGLIQTHRGEIDTPAFMPVGTQATVKGVFIDDIIKTGSQIILSNTYHLMIRPGTERVEAVGGLHKFMNCKLPILTDSGGYQVMSLSKFNKIDRDKGAIFQSHIDGKTFILSPEESIKIQKKLNSDIVMVMDECPKNTKDYNKIKSSMELSTEWAKRSKDEFGNNPHKALFGIVQGGLFNDLRIESLKKLINIKFDGYAIGGLAVGETQKEMFDVLDGIKDYLPEDKPRYLMGVGTPSDILGAVKRGIDMFDCVLPTRSGRTGLAFTWNGRIQIRNSENKFDNTPLDSNVTKFDLNKYSKNYLNHLHNTNEMLASMILTLNNINFYQELMYEIRKNIKMGTFEQFHDKYINIL
ncbi:tRNA guanosine(34) transglycosylase Tgt [Candidatus Pelagibacter sp.]|nr:tRNA guanosine(34) transglycosylase Tgt [Candidatus Pelagibacter sp.]